jgi:outer membrane protein assembly factor BamE (lipoprotein component of BamABCDE complex)
MTASNDYSRTQKSLLPLISLLALGAFLALTGCRTNPFSQDALAFVRPGETSRSEVTENLGAPTFDFKDQHLVAYVRETVVGSESHLALRHERSLQLFTTEGGPIGRKKRALCFLFDSTDRLKKFETILISSSQPLEDTIREWAAHTP